MNERKEIWKDIKGYEGCYKISNTGKVLSTERTIVTKFNNRKHVTRNRLLKPFVNKRGYFIVSLNKNNMKTKYSIHRLVAEAFIPNPSNLPQVNHKDECKSNNCVENLEWCTAKYNVEYSKTLLCAQAARQRSVMQFTKNNQPINVFPSSAEASRMTGVCQSNITLACQGKYKTAGGYIWKYYEEEKV